MTDKEKLIKKIKMVYKPLSKDDQDKFDKAQKEFYKYIKEQKGENNV